MPQATLKTNEIPAAIGKKVVIQQADGSQKTVIPVITDGNFMLVIHNRTQFHVPIKAATGTTLFTTD